MPRLLPLRLLAIPDKNFYAITMYIAEFRAFCILSVDGLVVVIIFDIKGQFIV